MRLTFTKVKDAVTPSLARKARALQNKQPVLRAMGTAIVSLTRQAFNDPSARPAPWPARKRNVAAGSRDRQGRFLKRSHALLKLSGELERGVHVGEVTNSRAVVGSPQVYAAVHQYGSKKRRGRGSGIPPRPFYPFVGEPGRAVPTLRAKLAIRAAAKAQLNAMLK